MQLVAGSFFEERFQAIAAAGVTQFAQGFGFDLANAFAGDIEVLSDFFQRVFTAVFQSKAQAENFLFARGEAFQNLRSLFLKIQGGHAGRRGRGHMIDDEIAQV